MLSGWLRPLYTADSGVSGGAAADTSAETKKTDTQQQEHMIPKSRFDEVNTELGELRAWKAKQEKADADAAKARQADADKAALEKGEFEKLAGERGTRITALEADAASKTERLATYEAEMEKQIKARLKALPEAIREMAPEGDLLSRYAWLDKAESAAAKLGTTQAATPRGTPAGPRGTGTATPNKPDTDLIEEKRRRIGAL